MEQVKNCLHAAVKDTQIRMWINIFGLNPTFRRTTASGILDDQIYPIMTIQQRRRIAKSLQCHVSTFLLNHL